MNWYRYLTMIIVGLALVYVFLVLLFSFFRRTRPRQAESELRLFVIDWILYSAIGDSIISLIQSIASFLSNIIRFLAIPIRYISSLLIRGNDWVDKKIEVVEKSLDSRTDADFDRTKARSEKSMERLFKREALRAKRRTAKAELQDARKNLRIPDFSKAGVNMPGESYGKQLLLDRQVEKTLWALKAGDLQNISVQSISNALSVSNEQAKRIRNELHRRGLAVKALNGSMQANLPND